MSVSDIDLIHAWKQVLTLSRLEAGQTVTVLTGADTHPQTLRCAIAASSVLWMREIAKLVIRTRPAAPLSSRA